MEKMQTHKLHADLSMNSFEFTQHTAFSPNH